MFSANTNGQYYRYTEDGAIIVLALYPYVFKLVSVWEECALCSAWVQMVAGWRRWEVLEANRRWLNNVRDSKPTYIQYGAEWATDYRDIAGTRSMLAVYNADMYLLCWLTRKEN